jgi:hypothetical protein
LEIIWMNTNVKRCELCGHSRAAHAGRLRCALCGCTPQQKRTLIQESFTFRTALPARRVAIGRKR